MTPDIDEALKTHRDGRLDEAERAYRAILEDRPDCAQALHLLGVIALQRGDPASAEALIRQAVALDPANAKFLNNFGVAAERLGRLGEAAERFAKAASLDPAFADAQANHGTALQALGRQEDAIAAFRRVLALDPGHARAHSNLGAALKATGESESAIAHFQAAADNDPALFEPLRNLCVIYKEAGLVEQARPLFDRALAARDNAGLRVNRATLLPAVYRDETQVAAARAELEQAVDALLADGLKIDDPLREVGLAAFYLPYQGFDDRALQCKLARLYAAACPALTFTAPHADPDAARRGAWQPAARLKVGFVSKFLHGHTIGKLNRGLIQGLDRRRFHVTTMTLAQPGDALAREIAASADRHVVLPANLAQARQIVADAKLDILLFTDIGMEPFTYFLAFARLAPLQCMTWGHPVTSGIEALDYFISNPHMDPPGAERHYSERLVRLGSFTSRYARPELPALAGRDSLGLGETARLYSCPQSLFKLHPRFDCVLADVLRRDPQGEVVLIEGSHAEWRHSLERRFASTMPDVAGRVRFLPRLSQAAFFTLLEVSDVLLDTTPFCGGNTTLEALAVGTPVVTLPGEFLRGRLSYAIYRQMDYTRCIASDPANYAEIATGLAMNPDERAAAKAEIRTRSAAVFEDDRIIGEVEHWMAAAVEERRAGGR